jgi:hypothetical protein
MRLFIEADRIAYTVRVVSGDFNYSANSWNARAETCATHKHAVRTRALIILGKIKALGLAAAKQEIIVLCCYLLAQLWFLSLSISCMDARYIPKQCVGGEEKLDKLIIDPGATLPVTLRPAACSAAATNNVVGRMTPA